jgi:FtsP/CotA-like multicopper oxidase with cupredoxin domain
MMRRGSATLALLLLAAGTARAQPAAPDSLPPVLIQDHRAPAGAVADGVLTLHLVAREGVWRPEGDAGPPVVVQAFGEAGGPLRNPGPMIRVPQGTEVRVTIENATADSLLEVHGLHTRPGSLDETLAIPAGETREARFTAGEPGTYFYWGTTTGASIIDRYERDSQLNGMLIVDPPGDRPLAEAAPGKPEERVFLISYWFENESEDSPGTMVINGLSWPHTERFTYLVGDTVRWRWVNASGAPHPMHLHGFYYRVDSVGTWAADSIYAPDARRLAVTERIAQGGTMAIVWVPERVGNWVFHCHFAFHISHFVRLGEPVPGHHMAGLVLGLHVVAPEEPPHRVAEAPVDVRRLRLVAQVDPDRFGDEEPGWGYQLAEGGAEVAADSIALPGPPIVLRRGQPVAITVVNRLAEPTAVHWHGIELESFPDGVPGWSGTPGRIMPSIAPGDSFTAEFVPPRAGTFMYHAHANELEQIGRGLYGPLLVLEPDHPFDPAADHVIVLSRGPLAEWPVLVNGRSEGGSIELAAGRPQRLRFVGIFAQGGALVSLRADTTLVSWRPVAKDGADLPPGQAVSRPAAQRIVAGEIYDYEVMSESAADWSLVLVDPLEPANVSTVAVRFR